MSFDQVLEVLMLIALTRVVIHVGLLLLVLIGVSIWKKAWAATIFLLLVFLVLFMLAPVPGFFGRGLLWTTLDDEPVVLQDTTLQLASTNVGSTVTSSTKEVEEKVAASSDADAVISQVLISGDVKAQLEKLGYQDLDSFASAWGITLGNNPGNAEVDAREVSICPFEDMCVRVFREKDELDRIIPFRLLSPAGCWLDGFRHIAGVLRPGSYTLPQKSGIPPKFSGLVEGITIRPCGNNTQPTSTSVNTEVEIYDVVADTPLNCRSEPGIDKEIVKTFPRGELISVVQKSGDWLKTDLDCWVAGWLTSANLPVPQAQASPTTIPSGMGGNSASTGTGPTSVAASVSVNWQKVGSDWTWNAYSNADGRPVEMTLMCPQDGEFVEAGIARSPIPAGTHMVTGITARSCSQ